MPRHRREDPDIPFDGNVLADVTMAVIADFARSTRRPEELHADGAVSFTATLPVLRGEIAEAVRFLLPGAESAAPWLLAGIFSQLTAVSTLLPLLEPEAERYLPSAILTCEYLYQVWYRLDALGEHSRQSSRPAVKPGVPTPSEELRIVRNTVDRHVHQLLGPYFPVPGKLRRLQAEQAKMICRIAKSEDDPYAAASGGWLLLAGVYALHDHPLLPRPGRRRWRLPRNRRSAALAGVAFELGEALPLVAALGLLEAEPPG